MLSCFTADGRQANCWLRYLIGQDKHGLLSAETFTPIWTALCSL